MGGRRQRAPLWHLSSWGGKDGVVSTWSQGAVDNGAAIPAAGEPAAWVGGMLATGLERVETDLAAIESGGKWAVAITFEGDVTAARFVSWRPMAPDLLPTGWVGPSPDSWRSSLDQRGYRAAVESIKEHISRGEVYQANICRVMSAVLPREGDSPAQRDPLSLAGVLATGNPSPYAGALRLPAHDGSPGVSIACASPELYLAREGDRVLSRPIKGTAKRPGGFLDKDTAENVMIVDLVRNDLGIIAEPGSVTVPEFLAEEQHPGLVHLVSGVAATLRPGIGWPELIGATFPPGSVTGAPKLSALSLISKLEPVPRRYYCGAFGWIDVDEGTAELAVAIRTFWIEPDEGDQMELHFGTGAGITWGSDAANEWRETQLKSARLVALASGRAVT